MKRLSRKDLEALGDRVITAYMKLPDVAGSQIYRVDPKLLCNGVLGLTLDYQHLSSDGSILGLTSYEKTYVELPGHDESGETYFLDGRTILVESDLNSDTVQFGRKNFTISHEASHQILKMVFPKDYGTRPHAPQLHYCKAHTMRNSPISDWEEWQSNTLASCILLPKFLLQQAMGLFGVGKGIRILNRLFYSEDYEKFVAMSELLGCSKTALAIRMKQLGYLERDYLDNPYRILDVECDEIWPE